MEKSGAFGEAGEDDRAVAGQGHRRNSDANFVATVPDPERAAYRICMPRVDDNGAAEERGGRAAEGVIVEDVATPSPTDLNSEIVIDGLGSEERHGRRRLGGRSSGRSRGRRSRAAGRCRSRRRRGRWARRRRLGVPGPGEDRHADGEGDDDRHDWVSSPTHSDDEQHAEYEQCCCHDDQRRGRRPGHGQGRARVHRCTPDRPPTIAVRVLTQRVESITKSPICSGQPPWSADPDATPESYRRPADTSLRTTECPLGSDARDSMQRPYVRNPSTG